ncbi:hypothetical protein AMTR_s00054p00200090 [Amborella trichopoda]|uniref:EF-hand domain-containing protein n=1 Tax=Amborella trichopoda TaxID=13333 RepID=U5CXX5_AMBTC|nr:hypothetical protein AMTR_s00054p00200090 [Amborella trichopoda]
MNGSLYHLELATSSAILSSNQRATNFTLSKPVTETQMPIEFKVLHQVIALQMTMPTHPSLNHSKLRDLFRAFDRDSNGNITAAELPLSMGHRLAFLRA